MQNRMLPVGDPGLERVLGGGLRFFSRAPSLPDSGVLLVRGGPGVGKSVLAAQVAVAAARALGGDVLFGCIELLPKEVTAQLDAFAWARAGVRLATLDEVSPEATATKGEPWLAAALLDAIPDPKEKEKDLGRAVATQFNTALTVGLVPRVVVIDSLAEGYGLGASTPRDYVDAVCKRFAQLGVLGILVEEAVGSEPTPWCFAVDTVLELGRERSGEGDEWVRTLTVSKHRFGASHPGPHVVTVGDKGLAVSPSLGAYDVFPFWRGLTAPERDPVQQIAWGPQEWPLPRELPPVRHAVVSVLGEDATRVACIVDRICAITRDGSEAGYDYVVSFDQRERPHSRTSKGVLGLQAPAPTRRPEVWLSQTTDHIQREWVNVRADGIRRFLIGDLAALAALADASKWRRAAYTLVQLLLGFNVPVVIYESGLGAHRWHPRHRVVGDVTPASEFSGLANVNIEVVRDAHDLAPTHLFASLQMHWSPPNRSPTSELVGPIDLS